MFDVSAVSEDYFDPIARLVETMRDSVPDLDPSHVMVVGAWCRDLFHAALGHDFEPRATRDIDLALALSGWEAYELLARAFPQAGGTGVRFKIAGLVTDVLPFGELEDPRGRIVPPTRGEAISVWGFAEIFSGSSQILIGPALAIRCPTVPGYAAMKLAAWLDRSEWGETKDANDLALIGYWYSESKYVEAQLYDTAEGQQVLVAEDVDRSRAAARLLGRDVAASLGPERMAELMARWPGDIDMLFRNLTVAGRPQWLASADHRREFADGLARGLTDPLLSNNQDSAKS